MNIEEVPKSKDPLDNANCHRIGQGTADKAQGHNGVGSPDEMPSLFLISKLRVLLSLDGQSLLRHA